MYYRRISKSLTEFSLFHKKRRGYFVEFSFVLSGFVLTHTYSFKNITFYKFILNRKFRLYLLHIFMFLLFFLMQIIQYIFVAYGINFSKIPFSGHFAVSEIKPNLLFLQSWFDFFDTGSWNYS